MSRYLFLGFLVALSLPVAAGQHERSGFVVEQVRPGIHLLQGRGGNILLSEGQDGLLLIDDDYADLTPALKSTLDSFGGWQRLKYIINTHWHGDHTGGNAVLGEVADMVAHQNVRLRLSTPQEVKFFNMVTEPSPEVALPTFTFQDQISLYFNGDELRVQHFPGGHTDGDSVVFFEQANVVHTGDHFFNGFFPFVDIDSGGNAVQLARNLRQIYQQLDDQTTVIPGHGPVADKKAVGEYLKMLDGTIAEVAAMKSQGMSLPAIQKKGLGSQWQRWGGGFIKEPAWIQLIYNSL